MEHWQSGKTRKAGTKGNCICRAVNDYFQIGVKVLVGWTRPETAQARSSVNASRVSPALSVALEFARSVRPSFISTAIFFQTIARNTKHMTYDLVRGFLCDVDKHITYAARGRGSHACEQCGKLTSAFSRPSEADLKTWGATRKTDAEVN